MNRAPVLTRAELYDLMYGKYPDIHYEDAVLAVARDHYHVFYEAELQKELEQERERMIAKVEAILGIKNDFGNVYTGHCSWSDWQALKEK